MKKQINVVSSICVVAHDILHPLFVRKHYRIHILSTGRSQEGRFDVFFPLP